MKSKRNLASTLALCSAVLVLSGCGGGNEDSGNAGDNGGSGGGTTSLPTSATASVDSFIAYMKVLVGSTDDTGNPVSLGDAAIPGSDTASPVGL